MPIQPQPTAEQAPTLGEIAETLRTMKDQGVTKASVVYVLDQVFFEDPPAVIEQP